jgi:hypothetical protein
VAGVSAGFSVDTDDRAAHFTHGEIITMLQQPADYPNLLALVGAQNRFRDERDGWRQAQKEKGVDIAQAKA